MEIDYVKSLFGRRCYVQFHNRQFKEQWRLLAMRRTEGQWINSAGVFSGVLWELGFEAPWGRGTQWVNLEEIKVLTESSMPPIPDKFLNKVEGAVK